MKKSSVIILSLIFTISAWADNKLSVGVGVGPLQSGLGVNLAWQTDTQYSYFGGGCLAHASTDSGDSTACGVKNW